MITHFDSSFAGHIDMDLDTPFLRRIREEGWQEGREEGRRTGWTEGIHAGLLEGQTAGALMARRRSILETLAWRFDPPVTVYQQIERVLETITDESHLAELLVAAVRAASIAEFQSALSARPS